MRKWTEFNTQKRLKGDIRRVQPWVDKVQTMFGSNATKPFDNLSL